ncbi:MAG: TIR domain-containing protein [Acidobacteria bacterium]|nr:TIR domain-containing protein [Acidobacteriota bacterium]
MANTSDTLLLEQMERLQISLRNPGRSHIIFLVANSAVLQSEVFKRLRETVTGYSFVEFDFANQPDDQLSLPRFCRTLHQPACVFAIGLDDLHQQSRQRYDTALSLLNSHREDIRDTKSAVILWMTPEREKDLQTRAADFSDWVTSHVSFEISEEVAHLLQQAKRFEDMLARPNLSPALAESFQNQLQLAQQQIQALWVPHVDVFLNFAPEDHEWAETLAKKLKDAGVSALSGHQTANLDSALKNSRKLIIGLSPEAIRHQSFQKSLASFLKSHPDAPPSERLVIPLLLKLCPTPEVLQQIPVIDFQRADDFDLRFRQLLEALDLPLHRFLREAPELEDAPHRERKFDREDRRLSGAESYRKGKRFEDEVADIYRLLRFEVKRNFELHSIQIDLQVQKKEAGFTIQAIVECKDTQITSKERDQILAQQNLAQRKLPMMRWIAISAQGFAAGSRTSLEEAGITCLTYGELLSELVPLEHYARKLIAEYEDWRQRRWLGNDWFIRPDVVADKVLRQYENPKPTPALKYIADWLGDSRENLLVLLGDLGTGKTTISSFLACNWAQAFLLDPVRHPAPVLISLKDVRKEISLPGIIVSHFDEKGLRDILFSRFEHLVKTGKIIVLFDAFDEMADRMLSDQIRNNFNQLSRAAKENGKVLITCRTHYFKNREEQARVIGQGPTLSETETKLKRDLRQRSDAEVLYLQEFNKKQIRQYIRQVVRPAEQVKTLRKLRKIHNLADLAHRPLLLDMIVKSLPELDQTNQKVTTATLYRVYTDLWIEREDTEKKNRILSGETRYRLMLELAWQMWNTDQTAIHFSELLTFVKKLMTERVIAVGDEEPELVDREIQAASFLKRDHSGNFLFMHRSFMEFFLACKLHECLIASDESARSVLNTKRFEQKVVFFLALLDETDQIAEVLRGILTAPYTAKVSENALQLLYWSGRIRCRMEEKINDLAKLQAEFSTRIPPGIQMPEAKLEGMMLEAACFSNANFHHAEFTKANLNHAEFEQTNFQAAKFESVSFTSAKLRNCDFRGANYDPSILATVVIEHCQGLISLTLDLQNLIPMVQLGHSNQVNAVAYSPDGNLIAVGSGNLVYLYQSQTGVLVQVLEGHQDWVSSVAFGGGGERVASGSYDGTVRVWNVERGEVVQVLEGHQDWVSSVAFVVDGKRVVSGSNNGTVWVWDVERGKVMQVLEGHQSGVSSVAFGMNGKRVASGSYDKTVRVWDVERGEVVQVLEGHQSGVSSVVFGMDGKRLASGSADRTVRVWDVERGEVVQVLEGHQSGVWSVAFGVDGKQVASGSSDKTVRVWDVERGEVVQVLEGHQSGVRSVAFGVDGRQVASGSSDKTVRVWNADRGEVMQVLIGHQSEVKSAAFGVDGKRLASGNHDGTVWVWNVERSEEAQALEGHKSRVWSVAFGRDGKWLASGSDGGTVRVWNVERGEVVQVLIGHQAWVSSVTFGIDKKELVSGSGDMTVRVWDLEQRQLVQALEGHKSWVTSVTFGGINGRSLASGSADGTVRIWNIEQGHAIQVLRSNQSGVSSVAFGVEEQQLASGNDDGTVHVWDVEQKRVVRVLSGHKLPVVSVAFEVDGKRLASGSDDGTVRLWDVETSQCLAILGKAPGSKSKYGHLGPVYTVSFAPNGKYLVAAGAAGRLQFWDFEREETFLYRYAFGPGAWLDLLPDGRFDGSPEGMRYLRYTELGTLRSYPAEDLWKEFYQPQAVKDVLDKYVR